MGWVMHGESRDDLQHLSNPFPPRDAVQSDPQHHYLCSPPSCGLIPLPWSCQGLSAPSRAAHEEQRQCGRWGADRGVLWYRNLLLSSGGRELSQRDDNQGHEHRCTQEGGDDNGTDSSGPQRACRDRNHSGVRLGGPEGKGSGVHPFCPVHRGPQDTLLSSSPPKCPSTRVPLQLQCGPILGLLPGPQSQASCQGHGSQHKWDAQHSAFLLHALPEHACCTTAGCCS